MEPTHQDPQSPQDLITEYHSDIRQIEIEGYELVIKKARNALFWAGGLIFLGEMISMFMNNGEFSWLIVGIALVEAGVFIGLGLYTKKKPFTAIVTGLIAFIGFIVLSAVLLGMNEGGIGVLKGLFSGILVKILILVALIRPLKEARELQKIKEEQKIN
jgi:hypothetical protein